MQIKLTRTANLGGVKDLNKGVHEVSDHLRNHWYVRALEKSGHLEVLKGPAKTEGVEKGTISAKPASKGQPSVVVPSATGKVAEQNFGLAAAPVVDGNASPGGDSKPKDKPSKKKG